VSPEQGPGIIAIVTGGSIRHTMVAQCLARLAPPAGNLEDIEEAAAAGRLEDNTPCGLTD
jgi:hypothetical protein